MAAAGRNILKSVRNISGIPTVVSHIKPQTSLAKRRVVTVVIPGNPGVVDFYDQFMDVLYDLSGNCAEILGLSHAGHGSLEGYSIPSDITRPLNEIYTLEEQITHKAACIEELIPQEAQLILVGHSIGAYMIIKLLEHFAGDRIIKGVLLFPTIERMADSPSGRVLTPASTYFYWPIVLTVQLLSFLPSSLHEWLINWWLSGSRRNIDSCVVTGALKIIDATSIKNSLSMGHIEMMEVAELDEKAISKHLDKLLFYYGRKDNWVPLSYYEDLVRTFPKAEVYLSENGIKHAFVEENSEHVAKMVWDWIKGYVLQDDQ